MSSSPGLPKRLIGFSTKMYFSNARTLSYTSDVASAFSSPPGSGTIGLFIVPTFPSIPGCTAILQKEAPHIMVGAQDCHWEDGGAHTGEVSARELAELGVRMAELGHAERRASPFNETDEMTARKAAAATRNGLIPLVCIGERERSSSGIASEGVGIAYREIVPQAKAVLDAVGPDADVVFAYEPVWAIGATKPAGADHVCAVVKELKAVIGQMGRTGEVRVLYGGSAGPGTWDGLRMELDGLFLGRFAHDINNLKTVVSEVLAGDKL